MKKKIDKLFIITSIACLLPILLGVFVYNSLPEMIPSHWNFSGDIDDYMPKAMIVFVMPAIMCLLNAFVHFALNNDPKNRNVWKTASLLGKCTIPVVSVFLVMTSILYGMGININIGAIMPVFVGVLFIAAGNYMPKCKQNYTVGLKLPWTLNSEENWNKTHRMAGKVWIIGGLLIISCTFLRNSGMVFFIAMLVTVAVPTCYSYYLYRKGI